jgi:hypothetical protein
MKFARNLSSLYTLQALIGCAKSPIRQNTELRTHAVRRPYVKSLHGRRVSALHRPSDSGELVIRSAKGQQVTFEMKEAANEAASRSRS